MDLQLLAAIAADHRQRHNAELLLVSDVRAAKQRRREQRRRRRAP